MKNYMLKMTKPLLTHPKKSVFRLAPYGLHRTSWYLLATRQTSSFCIEGLVTMNNGELLETAWTTITRSTML